MRWLIVGLFVAALLVTLQAEAEEQRLPLGAVVIVDASGRERTLADVVEGREAIVHLWATWCAPCLHELPQIAAARASDPELAARLVVISVDRGPYSRITRFLRDRLGIADLPTYQAVDGSIGSALAVMGYPTTLLIGADGTLVGRHTGVVPWRVLDGADDAAAAITES